MKLQLPTIPYTLIDAVNRHVAATGSVGYAMKAASADYNGHALTVDFNDYRKYWVTQYYWGERVVLARGSHDKALLAGLREYQRGIKGTSVLATVDDPEHVDYARSLGYVDYHTGVGDWYDARYLEVPHALRLNNMGIPAIRYLTESATLEEYKKRVKERQ